MELQEIASVNGAKGEDLEASKTMQDVKSDDTENLDKKTQELKEEEDHYAKLEHPQEDIYAEAFYCDTSEFKKAEKPTAAAGNIRLYKAMSIVLAVLCALLLLVTIGLAVKLQMGSAVCQATEENKSWSTEECKSVCATIQPPVSVVRPVTEQTRNCSREECKSVCTTVQPCVSVACPVTKQTRKCSRAECKSVCTTIQPSVSVVCPVTEQARNCSREECKSVCTTVQPPVSAMTEKARRCSADQCKSVCATIQPPVSAVCPVTEQARKCSADECKSVCAIIQPPSEDSGSGYLCHECPRGWLKFQGRCFFLHSTRLNWELSQSNCSARGGSLAVIDSKEIQDFLTRKGRGLNYWIGLKHNGVWTWVDKTVLRKSYWEDTSQTNGCAILGSQGSAEKNWKIHSCAVYNYFICQLHL